MIDFVHTQFFFYKHDFQYASQVFRVSLPDPKLLLCATQFVCREGVKGKKGVAGEIPSFDLLRQLRQVFPTDQVITEANDARVFYEQLLV